MNSLDKMEEEKMREAFAKWQTTEEALQSACQLTTAGFEYAIWKAAIAHANSQHSAILEDHDRLAKLAQKQAAIIAMQAEALKAVMRLDSYFNEHAGLVGIVKTAIHASAESVAAWEAKKLEPLQRQVAMQRDMLLFCTNFKLNQITQDEITRILRNTQATAEAYDNQHAAKVLEDAADYLDNNVCKTGHVTSDSTLQELRRMAAELRATNKEQGK